MGQGSLSLEHNGAMLLMRSEQPGDLEKFKECFGKVSSIYLNIILY